MRLKWKLVSICLGIVLILTQDTYTVCAKRTIGLEIILDAPNGGDVARVEYRFDPFRDGASIGAR
jgi:hypothetical protein